MGNYYADDYEAVTGSKVPKDAGNDVADIDKPLDSSAPDDGTVAKVIASPAKDSDKPKAKTTASTKG